MTDEQYIESPTFLDADFALICKGDSMINARIFDGDIVYIRQQHTVENGEIAAVLIDGEATLGRVWFSGSSTVIEPANPLYRSRVFHEEEKISIIGKAIAFTSTIKS